MVYKHFYTTTAHKHFYIGVCGYSGSGKTTFAEFLAEEPGVVIVDDGRPLRDGVKAIFGCSEEDVNTQEGKKRMVSLPPSTLDDQKEVQVRDLLGSLGNDLEARYGALIMPWMAIQKAEREIKQPSIVVLPSCRKGQGEMIRRANGIMIEITRDGCEPEFDFDRYDTRLVDFTIENDGLLEGLQTEAAGYFALAKDVQDDKSESKIRREKRIGLRGDESDTFLHSEAGYRSKPIVLGDPEE